MGPFQVVLFRHIYATFGIFLAIVILKGIRFLSLYNASLKIESLKQNDTNYSRDASARYTELRLKLEAFTSQLRRPRALK